MLQSPRSGPPTVRRRLAAGVLLSGVLATAAATAQELRGPVTKTVVFEQRHQFYVRGYEDPVAFDPGAASVRDLPTTASADEMAMHVLTLQAAGEVEAYLELLNEADREVFLRRLEERGESTRQLAQRWRQAWRGRLVELTRHVYRGREEIIRFAVLDAATRQPKRHDALVFRNGDDGLWELGELAGDAVMELGEFDGAEKIVERPWKSGG